MTVYRLIKDLPNWKENTICYLDEYGNLYSRNIHTNENQIIFYKEDIIRNKILESEWFSKEEARVMDAKEDTIMYVIDEHNNVIEKEVGNRPYYDYIHAFLSKEEAELQAEKNEIIFDIQNFCYENGINCKYNGEKYYHFTLTSYNNVYIKDSNDRYINNPFRFETHDDALFVSASFDITDLNKLFQ